MRRLIGTSWLRGLLSTLSLVLATAAEAETAADRLQPIRGLNVEIWNKWLSADEMVSRPEFLDIYPEWRAIVPPDKITALHAQGFDFLRLPFDPAPLIRIGPAQDALIDQIVAAVDQVHAAGLKAIVDMHSIARPGEDWGTDSIVGDPTLFAAHVALVGKVASRLNGIDPDRTAVEVPNEPTGDCDAIWQNAGPRLWPDQLKRLHAAARAGAPDLPIVVSGAWWGGIEGLEALGTDLPLDDNLLFSFHSYDPFLFSHQAASWTGGPTGFFSDLPYPTERIDDALAQTLVAAAEARARATGSTIARAELAQTTADYRSGGRAIVGAEILRAEAWAYSHGIPRHRLFLGEFGAMREDRSSRRFSQPDRPSFLAGKRQAAEAQGIGWSVWVWTGTFGIAADDQSRVIPPEVCASFDLRGC